MKRRTWFTLVEIVVALIIFGIGLLTLLRAIVYYVATWDEAKQKAEAILLAKEAMDIVYNQRDTNLRRSVRRDCARIDATKPEACALKFEVGKAYRTEFNGYTGYIIAPTTWWATENQLYKHTVNNTALYTHQTTTYPSPYKRYVEFSPASFGTWLSTDHALKMTVYVNYIRGSATRKVILESMLSAWEKDR